MTLKQFLAGTPPEFEEILTEAYYLDKKYFTKGSGCECYLDVYAKGQFVNPLRVVSLNAIKGVLINARNFIQDFKRGGTIALTTGCEGWDEGIICTVDIF